MTLARPPWSPEMSDGCSTPVLARVLDADLRAACRDCRDCCLAHDRAYYEGGPWAAKLRADVALFECVARRKGDTLALAMFNAIYRWGGPYWYVPPAVERGAQEGP